jgi:hypothetical protein
MTDLYGIFSCKAIRIRTSKVQQLRNATGVDWKYVAPCTWVCEDNIRSVWAVSTNTYDEPGYFPPRYYLYGDGTPKLVIWGVEGLYLM